LLLLYQHNKMDWTSKSDFTFYNLNRWKFGIFYKVTFPHIL
jgi:hypothetical protein